jgi:integrase/DNA-binding transcriptional regulator YhcF (GntR family)
VAPSKSPRRVRGRIETLPSGSLRVKVYVGIDPVSKKRLYLEETIPAGPRAAKEAEKARTRLLAQMDERRNPRTRATVNQVFDRYLTVLDVEPTTRSTYGGYIRNHIRPALGAIPLARLEAETVESFYAQLRTCRSRCGGRQSVDHRTADEHICDAGCRLHQCMPLSASSVRQIHAILTSACKRAVRWKWIGASPMSDVDPPAATAPNPRPPSAEQAASISAEAWKDPDWGMLVWLALMTGLRRGELCALTWDALDFENGLLSIRRSIAQVGSRTWEKDTKTHQQRRIALDAQTLQLLQLYRERRLRVAVEMGVTLPEEARIFSRDPDGRRWLLPDSVSQRYAKMCRRLGWDMNLHQLRHYSATELVAAGVDLRTIAGRLGHSGGGVTTLRVHSAWMPEADNRAATTLGSRLPTPQALTQVTGALAIEREEPADDTSPYRQIAGHLLGAIQCGALAEGDPLPAIKTLAKKYNVAFSTAQRAVALLADAGHVTVRPGRRTIVGRREVYDAAGIADAEGFAVNVSNRQTTAASAAWGRELSDLVGHRPFVVDVSRNGIGPPPDGPDGTAQWCNPAHQALGVAPTTRTGIRGVDALLWIKRPGESDGECGGEIS